MSGSEKNNEKNAKYIGNKVKVKVSRKKADRSVSSNASAETAQRLNLLSQGTGSNVPVDMTPVDYQPPDSADKLRELHEEGFKEGQRLIMAEQNDRQMSVGAVESEPCAAESAVSGENADELYPINEEPSFDNAETPLRENCDESAQENMFCETVNGKSAEPKTKQRKTGRKKKKALKKAAERNAQKNLVPVNNADDDNGSAMVEAASEVPADKAKKASGKRLTVPRTAAMVLSGLLMLYALAPLTLGVVTVGILPPLCIGIFFFAVAYFWPKICACRNPFYNMLFYACGIIVIAGITLMFYLFGLMYAASAAKPPANRSDYTVLVLGCKTIDDRPSLMLNDRLEVAAEFLKAHPGSYCIVSGGQGDDEVSPEATVMKRYLVEQGISPLRIVEETASTSTEENIVNSCAMLDNYNLYDDIVVVTDRFHQYRARHFVEKQGLRCYAVSSETRWYLALHYWLKEMVAVGLMQLGVEV